MMRGFKLLVILSLAFVLFLVGFWFGRTDIEIEEKPVE
jgi:hypothetical protein